MLTHKQAYSCTAPFALSNNMEQLLCMHRLDTTGATVLPTSAFTHLSCHASTLTVLVVTHAGARELAAQAVPRLSAPQR
jgi:hypothetical protein